MIKEIKPESLETVHTHTHTHTHTRKVYKLIKNIEIKNTSERIDLKGLNLKFNNSE